MLSDSRSFSHPCQRFMVIARNPASFIISPPAIATTSAVPKPLAISMRMFHARFGFVIMRADDAEADGMNTAMIQKKTRFHASHPSCRGRTRRRLAGRT